MKIAILSDTNPYLPLPPAHYTLNDLARGFASAGHRTTLIAPNHATTVRNFHGAHLLTFAATANSVLMRLVHFVTNLQFLHQQLRFIEADVVITSRHTLYSHLISWYLEATVVLESDLFTPKRLCLDLHQFYQRSVKRIEPDRRKLLIYTDFYTAAEAQLVIDVLQSLHSSINVLCVWWEQQGEQIAKQLKQALAERCNVIDQPLREHIANYHKHCGVLLHLSRVKLPPAYFVYAAAAGLPAISTAGIRLGKQGFLLVPQRNLTAVAMTVNSLTGLGKHKYNALRSELRTAALAYDQQQRVPQYVKYIHRIPKTRNPLPAKAQAWVRLPYWLTAR